MFEQLCETFRQASSSTLQAQQEMFRQWLQQCPPVAAPGAPSAWAEQQQRWFATTMALMNQQRVMFETTYQAGLELIEEAFKTAHARGPGDYRQMVEELWRRLSDTYKAQLEVGVHELQATMDRWQETKNRAAS